MIIVQIHGFVIKIRNQFYSRIFGAKFQRSAKKLDRFIKTYFSLLLTRKLAFSLRAKYLVKNGFQNIVWIWILPYCPSNQEGQGNKPRCLEVFGLRLSKTFYFDSDCETDEFCYFTYTWLKLQKQKKGKFL